MKKLSILLIFLTILLCVSVSAEVNVYEFYQQGCSHCIKVDNSGILEKVSSIEGVDVLKIDIKSSQGYEKYKYFHEKLEMQQGTPLAVVECSDGKLLYLIGDTPIINNLEEVVTNCSVSQEKLGALEKFKGFLQRCFSSELEKNGKLGSFGIFILVIAAIIDSVNPCAFGVLLFLMLSLLNLGSSKRALKAGILYSFIVFIVYFLAGLGIFKIIQSITQIRDYIYLIVGLLVLILSLIEFRDYLASTKGKESVLRISPKIKPFIEKYSRQGTIFAIMALGVIVAIFELPCTGGIYLAIISLLSQNPEMAVIYLLIYNLIFILPLLILTFIIYKGTSPQSLQKWSNKRRTIMKLSAAILMLILAVTLLWHPAKILLGLC